MQVFYFRRDGDLGVVEKTDGKGNLQQVDEIYVDDDLVRAVYDYTQYSERVKSGDLLFIDQNGGIVAVLDRAWPVQLAGRRHKELHLYKFDKRYK